ncbi:MAG: LuxR C-terminal-related transcriptional regulator [Candidatus Marinimicrobia bacterium]|nr:LuxR C-terminal-related transcriptional regulator [Candidatus Neomarinimicrobiota bacterium]MCF7829719.1 LuxR C-terminal-related transcriptional regulator [Candidatus Neomarinimicrobiota bacterium]MCF7881669.1 LuxR C-terminal-related transcriptional regulator [Candidatus Neomarinimicrobiota bacterium]
MTPNSHLPDGVLQGILRTKLHPPPLRPEILNRQRLIEMLSEHSYRLALITAPAGFGKSTCVRAWLEESEPNYAWLSLDDQDNNLRRFLRYLVASLQQVLPSLGTSTLAMLEGESLPSAETLLTPVINDLWEMDEPGTLVLDDYHTIDEPEIHEAMRFFIDQLPHTLRLVLITRVDPAFPVARYRARGTVAEIREQDLRFTRDETDMLLNQVLGMELPDESIETLNRKTEGWAAGLQLASLSLQQTEDKTAFLESFSGETGYVLDYLIEEVLEQLPDEQQQFLLQTSILQRFNAELCGVVTGDKNAEALLTTLNEQNLFLVPLDESGQWYRYHHLFGDLLRFRLNHALHIEIDTLHRRASEWFDEQGYPDDAMSHAFQMEDSGRAIRLLDDYSEQLIQESRHSEFRQWVNRLPEDELRKYPMILLGRAWMQLLSYQTENLDNTIQETVQAIHSQECQYSDSRKQRVEFFTQILQTFWQRVTGKVQASISLSEQLLTSFPEGQTVFRSTLLYNLARAYMYFGEVEKPIHLLEQLLRELPESGNYYLRLSAMGHICNLLIQLEGPAIAATRAHEYIDRLKELGISEIPAACYLHLALGIAEYQRNDIGKSITALETAVAQSRRGDDPYVEYHAHFQLAKCHYVKDDHPGAKTHEANAARVSRESTIGIYAADLQTDQLSVQAAADKFDKVAAELQSVNYVPDEVFTPIQEKQGFLIIRSALHRKESEQARPLIEQLKGTAEVKARKGSLLVLNIYEAAVEYIAGNLSDAFKILEQSLVRAANREEIRPFLEISPQMKKILSAYIESNTPSGDAREVARLILGKIRNDTAQSIIPGFKQDLISPLTEREQEVLSYLGENNTYQEIADSMFVSLNTVKTHLKNLYGKLEVSSKTEAIEKARQLGFLD